MPINSTDTQRSYSDPKQSDRHSAFGDVKEDLANVRDDVSKLASDTSRVAKDGVQVTWDSARKVADQVQTGHQKVCEYTSAHPTAALLIAVGVGAIAGRLLASRL